MQKPNKSDDYGLHDEYDLSKMTIVDKGRYAPHRRTGRNVVLLASDVVDVFPTDEAVNEALHLVMKMMSIQKKYQKRAVET